MNKSPQSHLPSLLGSLLFVLGAVFFLSVAVVMFLTALVSVFSGKSIEARQTILGAVSVFEALILVAATFVAIQRFRQKPFAEADTSFRISVWQVAASVAVAAVAIFIGYEVSANESVNWLVLPVLTVPAVALPLLAILSLAVHGLPLGTRWHSWSVFGLAMTLVPFFLIFLEIAALLVIVLLGVALLMIQPNAMTDVERLSQQIYLLGPESQAIQKLLLPYIAKPAVLAGALLYFSLLVPMVEEIFKPLGIWLLGRKLDSPAQGFALGALSGSAYALIETLGVSVQTVDWASLLLSRIGTGLLHITTSALLGAGIVYALREHRYGRLLARYALAVFFHGLWNGLAILYSFSALTDSLGQQNAFSGLQMPLIITMSVLAAFLLGVLVFSNRRMRTRLPEPMPPQTGS